MSKKWQSHFFEFCKSSQPEVVWICKELILQAKSTTREPGKAGLHDYSPADGCAARPTRRLFDRLSLYSVETVLAFFICLRLFAPCGGDVHAVGQQVVDTHAVILLDILFGIGEIQVAQDAVIVQLFNQRFVEHA